MFNYNIIKISCLISVMSTCLFSDCFVDSNYTGDEYGTNSNPCQTISCCITLTGNHDTIILRSGEHIIHDNIYLHSRKLLGESLNSTFIMSTKDQSCQDSTDYSLTGNSMIIVIGDAEIANITFKKHTSFEGHCYAILISSTDSENIPLIRNNIFNSISHNKSIVGPQESWYDAIYIDIKNNYFRASEQIHLRNISNNNSEIKIMNNLFHQMGDPIWISSATNSDNFVHIHNNLMIDSGLSVNGIDQASYNASKPNYPLGENTIEFYETFGDNNELGWISDSDKVFEYNLFAFNPISSILFDSGHPSSEFNDLDGSRGDIGLFGGEYSWALYGPGPVIETYSIDPIVVPIDGTININARAITE